MRLGAGVVRPAGGLDSERRRVDGEQQRPEGECAQLMALLVTSRLEDRPPISGRRFQVGCCEKGH
jgi:hypothetical protein